MINKKVFEIFSKNLEINIENQDSCKELSNFENWSSLTHLYIISDIEQEFNLEFDVNEIEKINTIHNFILTIKSKIK